MKDKLQYNSAYPD